MFSTLTGRYTPSSHKAVWGLHMLWLPQKDTFFPWTANLSRLKCAQIVLNSPRIGEKVDVSMFFQLPELSRELGKKYYRFSPEILVLKSQDVHLLQMVIQSVCQ